ncbi:MAG: helix-turn-helix transcriptional regulator, partial [Bacteroidales bacterium]|nr:helix-turn-helix transcriptional regulator [Bacteroidales bacterium]
MLQDRRRPLWPIAVMFAPIAVGNAFNFITRSYAFLPIAYIYFLLMCMGLIIYMVREVRRYGRWLRDNYADLEHKEVWQSFLIQTVILLTLGFYVFGLGWPAYEYVVQACDIFLVCYLLWRVETLSDLSISEPLPSPVEEETITTQATYEYIAPLLQQYCIDTHLYLQHDLTLLQLAKTIGTNRFYLSQYFSNQGTTYNAYINDLRVNYFIILYREAVDARRSFTAQQLAKESGFRNYNTFNNAFKRKMDLSVTAWMKQ